MSDPYRSIARGDEPGPSRPSRMTDAGAVLAFAIGLLAVMGWLLDSDPLKRVLPGLVAIKFNTAASFMLAGAALWWRGRPPLRIALGILAALVGALTLAEYVAGRDFGIDQVFIRDAATGAEAGYSPGRMAPPTALCFLLIGAALVLCRQGRAGFGRGGSRVAAHAAELLALTVAVIGGFSLIAYPTGAVFLRQLPGSIGMALNTAIAFLVLGLGTASAADGIVLGSVRSRGTGRLLWIGFATLTGLLAAVGVVFAMNLQTLADDLDLQANLARPRRDATLELRNRALGYGLYTRLAWSGDVQARRAISEEARGLERHLGEYTALARTDQQRALATRFGALWHDVHSSGESLLGATSPPSPNEPARFVALNLRLAKLLDEMRAEASSTLEARRAVTLRDIERSGDLPLGLLVACVLLALATGGIVVRAASRQERTVRQQREWLRVTLSSIGDAVAACDTERRLTFLNPVAEALTGWQEQEALGQPLTAVLRLINEETGEDAPDIAEQALREGGVVELANHTALLTRDGRQVPLEDSAAPITDSLGRVTGVVLVFHDVTQRRRAIAQLKESEARSSRAQEMAHLGSWELGVVDSRLTWSDEVYRIFGLEPQEFDATYAAFLARVHPDDRAAVDAAYSDSVRDGKDSYEIEHRVVRQDTGEIRHVHEKCRHERDPQGRIVRSLGMVLDITERKAAEEALRRSQAETQTLLENTPAGLVLFEAKRPYRVLAHNRYYQELFAEPFKSRGMVGLNVFDYAPAVEAEGVVAVFDEVVRTKEPKSFLDFPYQSNPPQPSWFNWHMSPLILDGEVQALVSMSLDVTDRHVAEEALRASEQKYRNLFENMAEEVHFWQLVRDQAGHIETWRLVDANPPTLKAWGRSSVSEIRGKTTEEIFGPGATEHYLPVVRKIMSEGVPHSYEDYFPNLDKHFRFTSVPLGEYFITTGVDITDIKRAWKKLEEANLRLAEADRRKNEFLAMLSHELRNPLAPIANSLYVLDRASPGGEQASRAKQVIGRQVVQLTNLVNDLLDVTRITRNKVHLHKEPLELNEVVHRAVEDSRSLFDLAGIHLDLTPAPRAVPLLADRTRVAQIIGNLLQNSAKFTRQGGRTHVSIAADGGEAVVRVADDGVGMERETLAQLFQPFMQAERTLDRSKGGLGLGLALVKGLAELHGGSVSAHSEGLRKGAEFAVRLPLPLAGEATVEGTAIRVDPPRARRRVLIIEDNVDAADSLYEALALDHHDIVVAYSGAEGIARAREFRPEVVLCDIGLPGMDGYEVARAIRADELLKGVFLVALSGYALPEDLQRAAEAGFERHLAKPPSIEQLEQLLADRFSS